mmetsp:Transcript_30337/g.63531  ORF Transcript_30337/g.63531 Transcript_30337/m.63531 type:complete len:304 (+) Transcript_30337:309-1220(+)
MSLRGRYVIDRIKNVVSKHFRLPCPPYGEPDYWDKAYTSFGPHDTYEWGDVTLSDIIKYNYFPVEWDAQRFSSHPSEESIESSLKAALNVERDGHDSSIETTTKQKERQRQLILMLGCGNSKLGEEMVVEGGFRGPIVQVDVSSAVVENMRQRCSDLVSKGSMNFVQDDATELSAFRDGMIDSCLDKGLLDAIFCAEDFQQLNQIQNTVSRVLKPGGSFVFFSFSRPEFILPKLMVFDEPSLSSSGSDGSRRKHVPWKNIEVQQLPKILLYKMQKKEDSDRLDVRSKERLIRSKANKKIRKRR